MTNPGQSGMSAHGVCTLQETSFEKDTAPHPLSAFMGRDLVMVVNPSAGTTWWHIGGLHPVGGAESS